MNTKDNNNMESEQKSKKWFWIAALLVLVTIVLGMILVQMNMKPTPIPPPVRESDVVPVVQPELTTLEEVAELTAGRPVPQANEAVSLGWDPNPLEHIRGNPDAKISIVQYSDIGNYYVKLMQPELTKLVQDNFNVNWIYRHFPDKSVENSFAASYIAECVSDLENNDVFWAYLDDVYEYDLISSEDALKEQAEIYGIDPSELSECITSELVEIHVKNDKHLGYVYGEVRFMPTFIFKNNDTGEIRVMEGVDTMEFVNKIIDSLQ